MNVLTTTTSRLIALALLLGTWVGLFSQPLYELHWADGGDPSFSGSGGGALTQSLDSACSMLGVSVSDTVNAPLGSFSPLIINPQLPGGGGDLTDLSGNMSFHLRVRSRETVTLGFLLRAGDGSSAFRTDRLETVVPGDTANWTEVTFAFDTATIGGFDSMDLRDVWFYLDPGTANFAGNEFYFDYFTIGAAPDSMSFSTCPSGDSTINDFILYETHWTSSSNPIFGGSGGATLTQELDSACSMITLSVTDTANAPLPAFNAITLNPQLPGGGGDLTDLSGNMSFHVRVRSRDSVTLGLLLRSADGSSAFRTDRLETLIPGDTANWTEVDFVFDSTELGGFDSTDLRDVWFYLDRGVENFAGNEFIFDYFTIGAAPDPATFSNCPEGSTIDPPVEGIAFALHYDSQSDPLFSGSAASALTQTIDSACSQLFLTVTAPDTAPWNGTSPIIVNPKDDMGNDITDLSGSMSFHLRVRSQDSVELALLLRAGDGSSAFRTDRISQIVPGDTMSWTEITFSFDSAALGGFDSTDLRDIWLYLDYGTDNFAGNAFWVDYFAIGPKPDPSTHSDCSLLPPFEFPWVLHWNDATADTLGGSESFKYTQTIDTACSQLGISVTEPIFDPHEPFKPIVVNPKDEFGNDVVDLSGNLRMYVRARSLEAVELAILLRSGGGSSGERTEIVRQMVPAGLDSWTELIYDFSGSNLVGFDSTNLRDLFLFLDRDEANFAGNEFYFDYVSIGLAPGEEENSDCVETVSIAKELQSKLLVFPNPLPAGQLLQVELATASGQDLELKLLSMSGQSLAELPQAFVGGQTKIAWQLPELVPGMYLIQVSGETGTQYQKLMIQ